MKIVINSNQKGLLFKNGVLQDFLGAGKYSAGGPKQIEALPIDEEISSKNATLSQILNKAVDRYKPDDLISEITVKNGEVALHYVDGVFENALTAGRHAFWKEAGAHEFKVYSTENPKITDIPATIAARLGGELVYDVNVPAECKTIVYYNGEPAEYLDAGRYFYWNGAVKVTTMSYSMRVQQIDISGQEILTKDRVGVRVNFTVNWKITDYKKLAETYPNITTTLYTAAQLALRDYLGGKTMDEMLADRENIGNEILEELKKRTADMYVEILSAGIKDVILPGKYLR